MYYIFIELMKCKITLKNIHKIRLFDLSQLTLSTFIKMIRYRRVF